MSAPQLGPVMKRLLHAPVWLYERDAGWLLGHRFLLLAHTGRTSRRPYRTVLEVIGTGPASGEYIVLAGLGRAADWYRNLHANHAAQVTVGRHRFDAVARDLGEDEARAVLADYERRNRLVAPIVHRVLSRLTGWRYDGSDASRRRLVRELPLVAFRPAPDGDRDPG